MTVFDDWLSEMSTRVDQLPIRCKVALFVACARALLPGYQLWLVATGQDNNEDLAERALAAASTYALTGTPLTANEELLSRVEAAVPFGEAIGHIDTTPAQDFWICTDVSLRVFTDPAYRGDAAIQYALEPLMQRVTERLYDCSDVGDGPEEDSQIQAILREPDMSAALDFVTWAADYLTDRTAPTDNDLTELTTRAAVIASN